MASLTKCIGSRGTTWRSEFSLRGDRKRKYLRLGKMPKESAKTFKTRVEFLIAAKEQGAAPDPETIRWAAERDDEFYNKLAEFGLVAPRIGRSVPTIADFVGAYIGRRTDVKERTIIWYKQTRRNLIDFF